MGKEIVLARRWFEAIAAYDDAVRAVAAEPSHARFMRPVAGFAAAAERARREFEAFEAVPAEVAVTDRLVEVEAWQSAHEVLGNGFDQNIDASAGFFVSVHRKDATDGETVAIAWLQDFERAQDGFDRLVDILRGDRDHVVLVEDVFDGTYVRVSDADRARPLLAAWGATVDGLEIAA